MRKLQEKIVIGSSRQAVWEVMADFGSAASWAPGMRWSNLTGDTETGVGTYRVMRHAWGFRIEEIVTRWTDFSGYSFKLAKAPFPMRDVCETWVLEGDDSQTKLTITVSYAMRLGFVGRSLDSILVRFVVAREMHRSVYGLKDYVEERSRGHDGASSY